MGVIANQGYFRRIRKSFFNKTSRVAFRLPVCFSSKKRRLLSREWHQLQKGIQRKYGIISSVTLLFSPYALCPFRCIMRT